MISEKAMATHSSSLAWKIPWMEGPGRLQSMESLGVRHGWATSLSLHFHALEKEMATHSSVLAWRIPGTEEPGGLPSMGSHRVGYDWSNLAAAVAAAEYLECGCGKITYRGWARPEPTEGSDQPCWIWEGLVQLSLTDVGKGWGGKPEGSQQFRAWWECPRHVAYGSQASQLVESQRVW